MKVITNNTGTVTGGAAPPTEEFSASDGISTDGNYSVKGVSGLGISQADTSAGPTLQTIASSEEATCRFSSQTVVDTPAGEVPIVTLSADDTALSYDQTTGKNVSEPVDEVLVHVDPVTIDLNISGEVIHTTPEHPFYMLGRGWRITLRRLGASSRR